MAKKNSTMWWRKKCDKLWSLIIRQVGRCEICGKTTGLVAHHLISKGANMKFRHDMSNGVCLCRYHHTMGREISAHGANDATTRFMEWLERERPGQWEWFVESRDNKSFEKMDYEAAYSWLKNFELI